MRASSQRVEFLGDSLGGQESQAGVRIGVVAERVAAAGDFFDERRECAHSNPDQKEASADLVARKQVKEPGSDVRDWGHRRT